VNVRIGLLTTLWKRETIENAVLAYYGGLTLGGADLVRVAVGSEGKKSRKRAETNGFQYIEAPNEPLSDKHQAGLLALREADVDAVVVIGSDDLLGGTYWSAALGHVRGGAEAFTVRGLYLYELASATLAYAPKVRPGAGRMYGRRLLDRLDWKLWRPGLARGLDRAAHDAAIRRANPYERCWEAERAGVIVLDVKSDVNLNSMRKTTGATRGVVTIPQPEAFFDEHFPGTLSLLHPEPRIPLDPITA
jgi:hypothetical protein